MSLTEKGKIGVRTWIAFVMAWGLLSGCAAVEEKAPPVPPVTFEEIVRLSKENVPPDVLIQKIADSGTVFRLSSDEVVELRREGVDPKVVDYMMETYTEYVRRNQEMLDDKRWALYGGRHYWWPDWEFYADRLYGPKHQER